MEDGNIGTFSTTLPWMERLIREGKDSPAIRNFAIRLNSRGGPEAAFNFVKSLPYQKDPQEFELLRGAPYLLKMAQRGQGFSDCDCRVILLNSILEAMGHKTRFVLIAKPGRKDFHHIYSEVRIDGEWIPLDTIFPGFKMGQEVENPGKKSIYNYRTPVFFWMIVAGFVLWGLR